uniref:C-type lectin domain-containing protein n=1 Tax=Sinocyclocheilus grahami TaxID=75366 RepID=A0A672P8B9_SINGR
MCVAFSQLRVSNKYVFVPEKVNWRDAQTYCRQHYTDIATVNNQQDNDNVLKTLANENGSGTTPLIWSDGSKFTYADWEPGQPSNNNNIQWCVKIYEKHWNDQDCYFKFPFVCHLDTEGEGAERTH